MRLSTILVLLPPCPIASHIVDDNSSQEFRSMDIDGQDVVSVSDVSIIIAAVTLFSLLELSTMYTV